MMPRLPTVRPHPNRRWLRRHLTGAFLAAAIALGGGRGGLAQPTAAETAVAASDAPVIAQVVVDLPDDSLAWTVATIAAEEGPSPVATDSVPGFVLGIEGAVVVRDAAGARTRLADGEALAVRPDDALTIQATGAVPASVSLLTLDRAGGDDLGAAIDADETFASPGGSRDVELVGDALAADETSRFAAGDAPTFVLVTGGSVAIEGDDDETRELEAGDTALIDGPFIVTGAAEDPSGFVAAVIGADVDAADEADADAVSVRQAPRTVSQPTQIDPVTSPGPSPTPTTDPPTPTPSLPTPTPVPPTSTPVPPTSTPDGNGPGDDPDGDGLLNRDEDFYGSNPTKYDTDDDGFGDGTEVFEVGTQPSMWDTDRDGLGDGDEIQYGANPLMPDTDNDGLTDTEEVFLGTDPLNPDTDGDGYSDGDEVHVHHTWATDPESHP